jgi:mRNA-degrading endonuclease RelE of RelBE toxin-antitoxin system
MFRVLLRPEALDDVNRFRAHDRTRILDEIRRHLTAAPGASTARTKELRLADGRRIRQLRVGEYRVFYDVDAETKTVVVRHVRRKGRSTTEEVL